MSDKADKLLALSRAGKRLQLWHLPGDKQEGFTMDSHGYVYIAQDSAGIVKLPWRDLPQLTKVTPPGRGS